MSEENPHNYRLAEVDCCLMCEFYRLGPPGVGLWCGNEKVRHDEPVQTRPNGICDLYEPR